MPRPYYPQTRISDRDVIEIRRLRNQENWSLDAIAQQFGISANYAGSLAAGRARWAAGGVIKKPVKLRGEAAPWAKLTTQQVHQIRALAAAGEPYCAIASGLDVAPETVRSVAMRRTWKHVPMPPGSAPNHRDLREAPRINAGE